MAGPVAGIVEKALNDAGDQPARFRP